MGAKGSLLHGPVAVKALPEDVALGRDGVAGSTLRCQQTIHGFGFMSITRDKNHIGQRQGKATWCQDS